MGGDDPTAFDTPRIALQGFDVDKDGLESGVDPMD